MLGNDFVFLLHLHKIADMPLVSNKLIIVNLFFFNMNVEYNDVFTLCMFRRRDERRKIGEKGVPSVWGASPEKISE